MSTPLACTGCAESEYSKYTSMTMCKLSLAPAWMTYKERGCVLYDSSTSRKIEEEN